MKRHGPDSLSSWVVALACCFINMMMYGMARLSGVLFVASVPRFNVNRQKASFPYTFCDFVRNSSGPLVGYLGHKFGLRLITAIGAVVGALGAGLCYFAQTIEMVTFLWGVIFGLGFGLGSVLLPVSVNQHFDKNRAIASGIALSGGCLGSFALPPIVEILINHYGLSSTFLFLAGFILNCLPAALLLRKPDFDIQKEKDPEKSETQSIISVKKVKLYSVEKDSSKPPIKHNPNSVVSIASETDENLCKNYTALTYEERLKRLSTQTLLSEYSIRMSTSEPFNDAQIIENSKGRRQVDPTVLEAEAFSLSSGNTEQDSVSEKDEVFEKNNRSSSVQHEKSIFAFKLPRTLSAEHIFNVDGSNFPEKKNAEAYQNYGYQQDTSETNYVANGARVPIKTYGSQTVAPKQLANKAMNLSRSYQSHSDDLKKLPEFLKKSHSLSDYEKNIEWSDTNSVVERKDVFYKKGSVDLNKTSFLGPFTIIFDPMFVLIAITNALYCFTFVCMVTIIVDFARDLKVGESNEKYVLMLMSVGDLAGRLCLGFVTDRGYMSTPAFSALCFACQGLFIAATVWSDGLITLLIFATLYGLSESGIIVIFPVIIAQFIEPDKQTVAIPSSNFLSGPLCLAVAPLIGYFRDEVGAYDWIFYGLAILSAACCLAWLFAPCIAKYQKRKHTKT